MGVGGKRVEERFNKKRGGARVRGDKERFFRSRGLSFAAYRYGSARFPSVVYVFARRRHGPATVFRRHGVVDVEKKPASPPAETTSDASVRECRPQRRSP